MTGLLACGENDAPPSTDADASMSDDLRPMPDGQLEAPGGPPPSCTTGLCATDVCWDAERKDLAHGCRFYAAQLDNVDADDGKMMMLLLTNSDPTRSANFRVEVRAPDGWTLAAPEGVVRAAGGATRVGVARPLLSNGYAQAGAFRITSDSPILATQIISDDGDRDSTSSSGTVLLPAHALDRHYMALAFTQVAGDTVAATPGSRDGAGVIAIVATQDGTTVHLTPKIVTLVDHGISYPGMPGGDYTASLEEGDVLQVFSYQPGGDLSGTIIDADRPVSVFSGNVFTTYGNVMQGFNGGDMAVEQMPPLSSWGNEYIGARLAPQDGCDPFLGPGGGMWQVIAAQDNTKVTISPSGGTLVEINNTTFSVPIPFVLNRGESRVFTTLPDPAWPASAPPPTGDIVAIADGGSPILLAQWLDCEPGMSLGIDTRLGTRTNMTIAFPPGFDQQVTITRRLGVPVQFDGYTIPEEFFRRISKDYAYEVARLNQDQFGTCLNEVDPGCQHTITSPASAVGLSWRGADVVCSYAVTVPPSNPCVQPGCVP